MLRTERILEKPETFFLFYRRFVLQDNWEVDYTGVNSGAGKDAILRREVDFAVSDSLLSDEVLLRSDLQVLSIRPREPCGLYRRPYCADAANPGGRRRADIQP